ncbi:hypothetical protein AXK11_08025 [Cephaloticoccus primus]|uniref:Cytochrome c domain-containing protein n=1 Tax=Cephaloticoccus primus TaxID=1548207 RepID=A0A139SJE8_9BACT|nr:cbb3-type cytochrome c oxidase subunit II [Cephaloticoccus primus]KXU34667.1 hypothetical protein AXK11_08025 [Cephaloticoccus primus]
MKNSAVFFLGLFAVFALSWAGVVLGTHGQLGELAPHFDEMEEKAFPLRQSGLAARGQQVFQDLGCIACHTQQVRRPDYGSDKARGWGERQSVARDYIYQARPLLGSNRAGPDLANYGARAAEKEMTEADMLVELYNGGDERPPHRFLFELRKIVGEPSPKALHGVAPEGYELVPTERAENLIAYLLSLKQTYQFAEARPYEGDGETEGGAE